MAELTAGQAFALGGTWGAISGAGLWMELTDSGRAFRARHFGVGAPSLIWEIDVGELHSPPRPVVLVDYLNSYEDSAVTCPSPKFMDIVVTPTPAAAAPTPTANALYGLEYDASSCPEVRLGDIVVLPVVSTVAPPDGKTPSAPLVLVLVLDHLRPLQTAIARVCEVFASLWTGLLSHWYGLSPISTLLLVLSCLTSLVLAFVVSLLRVIQGSLQEALDEVKVAQDLVGAAIQRAARAEKECGELRLTLSKYKSDLGSFSSRLTTLQNRPPPPPPPPRPQPPAPQQANPRHLHLVQQMRAFNTSDNRTRFEFARATQILANDDVASHLVAYVGAVRGEMWATVRR